MIKFFVTLLLSVTITAAAYGQSNLERGVVDELNMARSQPQHYADFLREYRKLFRGNSLYRSGSNVRITTAEGVRAVDEAIRFLEKQRPLQPFVFSTGLSEAAAELVADQASSGQTGHNGGRSGSMKQRIERHGQWQGSIGENIGYGYDDPRWIVIQLIVDDGVLSRGHRKNIFTPRFRRVGVACGGHAGYGAMCVTDFAEAFSR